MPSAGESCRPVLSLTVMTLVFDSTLQFLNRLPDTTVVRVDDECSFVADDRLIELAVLVDRNGRELPIQADYALKAETLNRDERIGRLFGSLSNLEWMSGMKLSTSTHI